MHLTIIPGGLEPPADMDEAEAKVWRKVVDKIEPQSYGALREYCRHVVAMKVEVTEVRRLASELGLGDWGTPRLNGERDGGGYSPGL